METPTILYLNNRYVNSLEELKAYFGSKLNEAQKGELIAAFRDKVLYDWLNEGGDAEKQIAGDLLPILDQNLGNGEVLAKIAELFEVPNSLIADYKFVDHAEYLGCDFLGSDDEQTQHPTVPNTGVIHIKKGVTKCRIVFKFKILAPENDFLSLQMEISPKIENAMSMKQAKLDLVGKKNETKTIELDIDVEKLCKDCSLTLSHDNSVVGCVTIDNHENTDKVIEETEGLGLEDHNRINILARVKTGNSYSFFDETGNRVKMASSSNSHLMSHMADNRLQLLRNDMYPDGREYEFGFYVSEQGRTKRLFYVDISGFLDLGLVDDAIPLSERLVAVRKKKNNRCYGIIDNKGKEVLADDKYGKIVGISNNNYIVCEIVKGKFGLVDLSNNMVVDKNYSSYFVNPFTNIICAYNKDENPFYVFTMNENKFVEVDGPAERRVRSLLKVFRDYVIEYYFDYFSRYRMALYQINPDVLYKGSFSIDEWKAKGRFLYKESPTQKSIRLDDRIMSVDKSGFIDTPDTEKPILSTSKWVLGSEVGKRIVPLYFDSNHKSSFVCFDRNNERIQVRYIDGSMISFEPSYSISQIQRMNYTVSYGNYISVGFSLKNPNDIITFVFEKGGKLVLEDPMGNFPYLCGPFEEKFYYLKEGCMWSLYGQEKKQLSSGLKLKELYPLGTMGRFLVCGEEGVEKYAIVDNNGVVQGKPFDISFSKDKKKRRLIWDFLCNSQYLPIKNKEGKCGLIDTNGKIIVPCEYDEVEDLNSIFKREGIVIF